MIVARRQKRKVSVDPKTKIACAEEHKPGHWVQVGALSCCLGNIWKKWNVFWDPSANRSRQPEQNAQRDGCLGSCIAPGLGCLHFYLLHRCLCPSFSIHTPESSSEVRHFAYILMKGLHWEAVNTVKSWWGVKFLCPPATTEWELGGSGFHAGEFQSFLGVPWLSRPFRWSDQTRCRSEHPTVAVMR